MTDINEQAKLAFFLTAKYRSEGRFQKSIPISLDHTGAARYLSYVAYPQVSDSKSRQRFEHAMLCGAAREYGKEKGSTLSRANLLKCFGVDKLLSWRDIDSAITGKGEKLGGGTGKLIKRFHAYHVFRINDSAQPNQQNVTHQDVLGKVSEVYESIGSKISDEDTRLDHLKRTFRQGRPVLHLIYGLVESHRAMGWCSDLGQLNQGVKPAIYDPAWIADANEIASLVLGLQLIEHESFLRTGKRLRKHKFDPSEVIDVHLQASGSISGP